jgi:putative transposase
VSNSKLLNNEFFSKEELDTSTWNDVLVENLEGEKKEMFLKRKAAIDMHLTENYSRDEISKKTGISVRMITRLIKKCLQRDINGKLLGYTGLIPYKHNKVKIDFNNNLPISNFNSLLQVYPVLEDTIKNTLKRNKKNLIDKQNISFKNTYIAFIKKCKDIGITQTDYPFNTKTIARSAVYRYIKKTIEQDHKRYSYFQSKEAYRKSKIDRKDVSRNNYVNLPFERVEFDGHRIDGIFCIDVEDKNSKEIFRKTMSRLWLLVIIDVATRTVLGYHISLNQEYNSDDVMKCIKNSIETRNKMTLTIKNLKYPDNGGYHSLAIKETKWAVWEEFCYDNAKAHLSKYIKDFLLDTLKCSINTGPVAMPEKRGIIERFFGVLEDSVYHRLPNTTGSNLHDPIRNNPEKQAIKFNINLNDLFELTEIVIAEYNNRPKRILDALSPLEAMEHKINNLCKPRLLKEELRNDRTFYKTYYKRTIRGNIRNGTLPYIFFMGAKYQNEVLMETPDLVGKKVTLEINREDLRTLKAYLSDGSGLGILTANDKWSRTPNTLYERKAINRLLNKKLINIELGDDAMDVYKSYLNRNMLNNKKTLNQKVKVDRYLEKNKGKIIDTKKDNNDTTNYNNDNDTTNNNDDKKVKIKKGSLKTIIY